MYRFLHSSSVPGSFVNGASAPVETNETILTSLVAPLPGVGLSIRINGAQPFIIVRPTAVINAPSIFVLDASSTNGKSWNISSSNHLAASIASSCVGLSGISGSLNPAGGV